MTLELLCNAFPTGAIVLDASGRIIFANREGKELLHRWTSGRHPAMKGKARIPDEIASACERLRHGGPVRGGRPKFGGRILIRHPRVSSLSAVVALERSPRDRRLAAFCVFLQDRLKDNLGGGRREQLAMLTVAERTVAKLVAEGLRNQEIASTLGKSVTTVKSQVAAVFAKLEVRSRTELVALLRSA